MNMKKAMFFAIMALGIVGAGVETSYAACNAIVNGRPMSQQECASATAIYGYVEPGYYWLDAQGNWGKRGAAYPQGNLYRDAQRRSAQGGNAAPYYRGHNDRGPFGNYMSDGRCSFVNGVPVGNCN
jgi:hypothetical protein